MIWRAKQPVQVNDSDASPTQNADLVTAYQADATIGVRFGVHAKTVATRLRHEGVELRPRRGWA